MLTSNLLLSLLLLVSASITFVTSSEPEGCWVVKDNWPVKTCKRENQASICSRGYGAWSSESICCSPGVAFPEGCGEKLTDCWVVESSAIKTCKRDMRRCEQGYGVFASQISCCYGLFKQNCTVLPKAEKTCWVVDTYWPSRLCMSSDTLCGPIAQEAGVQSWATKEECCSVASGAFGQEGCSIKVPPTPCWVIDSYNPRSCRKENETSVCNRGWGVFETQSVCCAPNVAFPEGCSSVPLSSPAITSSMGP